MRVGFIGCGSHATNSVYPALRPAGVELVATCANHLENAERNARWFGAQQAYDDVAKLLDHGRLDAVLVSVPPHAYADIVIQALDAGLPVFSEKPGAATVEQLVDIERASNRAGKTVMVGYMKRFARAYRVAKHFVDGDDFGRVTSIHAKFVMGPGFGSLRNYLIDNPVHALDLMRFFGGEVADIEARALSIDDNRHAVSVLASFVSGAVGTAQLGTIASFQQENELLEVVGEQHSVTVTNVDTVVCRPPTGVVAVDRPSYTVPDRANFTGDVMGFVPELEHFRDVVTTGADCASDVSSATRTLALVEQIWQQVR